MEKYSIYKKIFCSLNALHLADKCLLVFMTIFMFQSAFNLLLTQGSDTFDVIVRTTAAAIFGYFISENFQNGGKTMTKDKQKKSNMMTIADSFSDNSKPRAQIGFSAKTEDHEIYTGNADVTDERQPECRNRLQILVVAIIGIFALLILVIANDYLTPNATSAATLSQFRDFVSGSVGFLIGHSTHQQKTF